MSRKTIKTIIDQPFNNLPFLPPDKESTETKNILRQVVKSSLALAELKGLVHTLPNPDILLNAVILKEARASSEIENVITTQDKLYQALSAKGTQVDTATKEVLRYREAILSGFQQIKKKGFINANIIIQIQKVLEDNNAGIRKLPGTALKNAATGKVIYTPPDNYHTIIRLMKNLEDYLNEEVELSPLINLAIQHYQFESIHPFYDGNGRTGRIINVLYLILHGLLDSPILYLSEFIIENKSDYYRLLQEVRTKENWEEWILFILTAIEKTSKETIHQIQQINKLFQTVSDKIKEEFPKSFNKELVELLFEQPYCKIDFVIERLNISRITASKYLKELKQIGILESKQVWKETLYINTKLFDLLKG
ncbi:MAG: Fic family protein [Bacteroidota bacterium]|jgi:Fic family protein|nr:Fic family protein [Bacteroidota bacterium]